jgi:hypothetical protein
MGAAQERRLRSEQLLRERGVPTLESLGAIESEDEVAIRAPREVAERAIVLFVVATGAAEFEPDWAIRFLHARGLWDAATPNEQAFLVSLYPDSEDRFALIWRYEAVWVLLWALGYVDTLEFPEDVCDAPRAADVILGTPVDDFVVRATLRPAAQILDEADLIYRCHWATFEARGQEDVPGNMDPDVVIERHHALNWLIGYANRPWDDVPTDT